MNLRLRLTSLSVLALLVVSASAVAGQAPTQSIQDLRKRAESVSAQIGDLLKAGVLDSSDEAIELLKKLTQELAEIRASLKRLEDAKVPPAATPRTGYALNGTFPITLNESYIGKSFFSGFQQYQYTNTDQLNGPNDAFRSRRVRWNFNHLANEKTLGRVSLEMGSGVNQTTAQVRDALIQYRPNGFFTPKGISFTFGQQNAPLGYEISYPSPTRLWPERAQYEQAFFGGERGRGLLIHSGDTKNFIYAGPWNALNVNDFEQVNNPAGGDSEVGIVGGARFTNGHWSGGVSALFTNRPQFETGTVTLPNVKREFQYIDLTYSDPKSRFVIRTEAMTGTDRNPVVTANSINHARFAAGTRFTGYHGSFDLNLRKGHFAVLRYEMFDRDRAGVADAISLWGLGWVLDVNPNLRYSITHEWVADGLRQRLGQTQYGLSTFRAQYRF